MGKRLVQRLRIPDFPEISRGRGNLLISSPARCDGLSEIEKRALHTHVYRYRGGIRWFGRVRSRNRTSAPRNGANGASMHGGAVSKIRGGRTLANTCEYARSAGRPIVTIVANSEILLSPRMYLLYRRVTPPGCIVPCQITFARSKFPPPLLG